MCKAEGKREVVITLRDGTAFGHTLDCIHGDFIVDMTPCPPDGGFSMSAPTGSAEIVGIAMRWQDYTNHLGGVVGHSMNRESVYFDGGFMSLDSGLHRLWHFEVSRLTGIGKLVVVSKPEVNFDCASVKPKF